VDGNRFHAFRQTPHACIVKGDGKYAAIAAASILAKTHRDAYMEQLDRDFPQYGWRVNKGYPTAAHRNAIRAHGASPHHRKSFRLLPEMGQGMLF
jgi:ribonuclease HII